jgi:hypothetical protein
MGSPQALSVPVRGSAENSAPDCLARGVRRLSLRQSVYQNNELIDSASGLHDTTSEVVRHHQQAVRRIIQCLPEAVPPNGVAIRCAGLC